MVDVEPATVVAGVEVRDGSRSGARGACGLPVSNTSERVVNFILVHGRTAQAVERAALSKLDVQRPPRIAFVTRWFPPGARRPEIYFNLARAIEAISAARCG